MQRQLRRLRFAEVEGVGGGLVGKVVLGFQGGKSRNKWAIIDRREQRVQNRGGAADDADGRQASHRSTAAGEFALRGRVARSRALTSAPPTAANAPADTYLPSERSREER